ncbi:cyclin-J isoform X2 [Oryzias latipes]|uniref:cyclin-J isoform X2 n=1 Tax=Oryzias latipes TaxID=8090 RepID=UPI000CE17170|nr:cyclin-J isoform X2 [Oryzias latipes]
MELEDQWWRGQLAADIYQALRYKELKLPSFKGQSPQLNLRRYFADLIAVISNHLQLCPPARHLAVYLLDLFMDRYDVTVQQLHMVSLACLLLASKFEEREDRVPKLETLNGLGCMSSMNLVLTKQGLLHMELLLLETFQWNLYLPTAAHYIEYFLSAAVHEGDLHDGWPMTSVEKTKVYMLKYADYFLEVSLQACVAASRLTLHLSPTWPPRLHRLSGYTWENLVPCAEKLLIAHDSDVKEDHKQKCRQPVQQQQQQQQQQDQSMYHSSGQSASVAQYLHLSGVQYPQQTLQSGLPSSHYLSQSVASLQPLPGSQHPTSQAPATSLDPKPNRSHQVSMQYSSAASCFDR